DRLFAFSAVAEDEALDRFGRGREAADGAKFHALVRRPSGDQIGVVSVSEAYGDMQAGHRRQRRQPVAAKLMQSRQEQPAALAVDPAHSPHVAAEAAFGDEVGEDFLIPPKPARAMGSPPDQARSLAAGGQSEPTSKSRSRGSAPLSDIRRL